MSATARPSGTADPTGVRRTVATTSALMLAALPLYQIFTDGRWLVDVWLALIVTALPLVVLRLWWRPRIIQAPAAAALALVWLTARYVPDNAWGGLIPSGRTWDDVATQVSTLSAVVHNSVAPLASTPEARMALAAGAAALLLVVDAVAVVWRRPALAGLPILVVFTVSGAVPRRPVNWALFAAAAAGFFVLLASDGKDAVGRWGRLMPRPSGPAEPRVGQLARSGRVVATLAIALAVFVPFAVPGRSQNSLADALHNPVNGVTGVGPGPGISLNPFVSLQGQLTRDQPAALFDVTVRRAADSGNGKLAPFYVRANVLDRFDGASWTSDGHGPVRPTATGQYPTELPQSSAVSTFQAQFTVKALRDTPPLFAQPTELGGLSDGVQWTPRDQLLTSDVVSQGDGYTETVAQPSPSPTQLRTAPAASGQEYARWLQLPGGLPSRVTNLVAQLTRNTASPYDAALALLAYLAPANGFQYSLSTKSGDSGNALTDFLFTTKTGYCQQYAASLATMLRLARIPARIVLGYTHHSPDASGSFEVTTNDAHAWVEAYFVGVGWVPFDPTPLTGPDAARAVPLAWAPNGGQAGSNDSDPRAHPASVTPGASAAPSSAAARAAGSTGTGRSSGSGGAGWTTAAEVLAAMVLLAAVLAGPGLLRQVRRRRRLRAAQDGDADALWDELTATAADLGYVWADSRTPRQVARLLDDAVGPVAASSLATITTAVERARYAPAQPTVAQPDAGRRGDGSRDRDALIRDLGAVEAALWRSRAGSVRLRARLRPASVRRVSWQVSLRRFALRARRRH